MTDQSKPERLRELADNLEEAEVENIHGYSAVLLGQKLGEAMEALREYADLLDRPQEASGGLDIVKLNRALCDGEGHVLGRPLRECLRCHEQFAHDERPVEPGETCGWAYDEDGIWQTDCGESFVLMEGTPEDNDFRFCCYCGKNLPHWNPSTKSGDAT